MAKTIKTRTSGNKRNSDLHELRTAQVQEFEPTTERQIEVFEREYPPQHFHAFHYIEGVGKIHESVT